MKSKITFLTISLILLRIGLSAQTLAHPSIWVNASDRTRILNNIANYSWATGLNNQLHSRNDAIVNTHKTSPQTFLATISGMPGSRTTHRSVLNTAAECAILYYLTGNNDYAQFSADVLQDYTKKIAATGSVNLYNDFFIEFREAYPKFGIIYDFIYPFLKDANTTIYNRATGTRAAFDNTAAQFTFKRLADDVFNEGNTGSNHSILEDNGALFNLLCVDDDAQRDILFNKFLNGTSNNDAFVGFSLARFSPEEGIWPESVTYSKGPQEIVLQMMDVIDRYKPSLNIITNNQRILDGAFIFENLKYPPNKNIALYGDSRRDDDDSDNLYRRVNWIANRKGLSTYLEKASKILKKSYDDNGGYSPTISTETLEWSNPLDLLWGVNVGNDVTAAGNLFNTSAKISHAGVMLQRNYNGTSALSDGLVGFIGGAHYVHSHLTGIDMELYGRGYVLGAGGGDTAPDDRASDIYTNYYRIYAGHNTVIANGQSVGRGQGSWKSDGLLFQNNTVNIAAEPASTANPISTKYSFATQFLDDNINNLDQQRTLSIIRTSATTAYYLDIFRSKSNTTNNFHDYIYHNLGDEYTLTNLDASPMALTATPSRYPTNPVTYNGATINFPGWHYFENPATSAVSTAGAKATFRLTASPNAYMFMLMPGAQDREYTKALAPPTLETAAAYANKKTNVIVVRQNGEAWNRPFISVLEPSGVATSSVTNVENIIDNNVIIGTKVTSLVNGQSITDYIISQPDANLIYTNSALNNFSFIGRFGILRVATKGTDVDVNMYIGEGTTMVYDGRTLNSSAGNKGYFEYGPNANNVPIGPPVTPPANFIPEKIQIEAEDYNTGGNNVGYLDNDNTNQGTNTTYRSDAIDISNFANASNGIVVADFAGTLTNNNGDWMKYTFNVINAGDYKISVVASRGGASTVTPGGQFNIDDSYAVKTVDIANTGSNYVQFDVVGTVYLSAGTHLMRYGSRASKSHNPDKFIIERQNTGNAPLPVSLLYFKAEKTTVGSLLTWETASETNNSHYLIYHSLKGTYFKEILKVNSKNKASKYQYIDKAAQSGNNYYKLVQVDFDGTSTDLGIKVVNFNLKQEETIVVYPNPADRKVNINFGEVLESNIQIKVYNLSGKELQNVVIPFQKDQASYTLELDNKITTGIYIIKISSGAYNHTERLSVK